ncbi:PGDYG domain-containing protein [Parvibium lacunae]|uniref:Uncharacterized protein n=1 Tax=Parvibium lacunae TaxID=1888893 RepID=A0A368L2Z7_9BURK|nr:PGDYG domain-containing protein [Parvibium lacunae]RCS57478.1 hypothetical protein DU000_08480 [Parvibium lacunae]
MLFLNSLLLESDPAARRYVKQEVVQVVFAKAPGALMSLEGANRYAVGDAILTSHAGGQVNTWVVSRDRFDAKYFPLSVEHGVEGDYQNHPVPVWAKQMNAPFSLARCEGGDVLQGQAGDWVMQYAPNDYGITEQIRFAAVYRPWTA